MRGTWIVCVAAALGCGPAVETEGGTEIEAETEVGNPGSSTGGLTTSASVLPEPSTTEPGMTSIDGTASSGVTTEGVTTGAPLTDGEFFLAIFVTPIAPSTPFQFIAEVKAGGGQLVMSLTSLSLDVLSVDSPREPVPPPFEVSGPLGADGSFTIEIPNLSIPGQSNPVTGSDMAASVTLEGVLEMDRICGRVSGMITLPANIDLEGSTFAGIRTEGGPLPLLADLDCDP